MCEDSLSVSPARRRAYDVACGRHKDLIYEVDPMLFFGRHSGVT